MTITDTTPIALDGLRGMTDDQIAALYYTDDQDTSAAALAEMDRRDRAAKMGSARRALDGIRAEGDSAAFAQYLDADAHCRGELLSREGKAAFDRGEISDEQALWRMPWHRAERYCSEELIEYFKYTAPRITAADYVRQQAAQRRTALAEARDASNGGNDHEQDLYRVQRLGRPAGLAADDAGSLRHVSLAEETPQAGSDGPVHGGGSGDNHSEDGGQDGPGAGGPGGPVHGDGLVSPDPDGEQAPGDLKFILDEAADFVARYVACTQAQADVMTLYAAATNGIRAFPAFGRMLFTSEKEASGKTVALMVTATLSANPLDASGTPYALQSALAGASNAPEQLTPTLYLDEISELFGRSGLAASRNPVAEILRKGYKSGATHSWSVNRTAEKYSIYTPFVLAGLRNAVPRDIRSRCICVVMQAGSPEAYFDTREAEPEARALAASLGQAVTSRITAIGDFRARGIHPKLRDRHLEVWEPLFAVAYILGGQEWLNRCLAAFRELALADAGEVILTPRQQVLRDAAELLDDQLADMAATGFVGGLALADEMRRLDNPLYAVRSEGGMAKLISDAMPVPTTQKRVDGKPVRGYFAREIRQAWEAVRPAEMEDASIVEEANPFAVTDDTEDDTAEHTLTWPVTGDTSETDESAAQ